MRAQPRSGVTAAAALLACAVFALTAPESAHAHEGHSHEQAAPKKAGDAAAPARPAVRNRWGANYFPNVELITQHGTKVRLYDDLLKGKTVAINLIFTDCVDVCPLSTAKLVELRKILGKRVGRDIVFYSISIDPERDTPAVLKAYAEKFGVGAESDWLFLTGKPKDIQLATKKLGLVRGTDWATRDRHTAALLIGDEPNGQWTRTATTDSSAFLATRIGSLLGWRDTGPAQSYAAARPLAVETGLLPSERDDTKNNADVRALNVETGQYIFQNRCGVCHTIGQGEKIGPDLLDVTVRRERGWLARYIRAPDELLAEGDPIATALFEKYNRLQMPNLRLAREEVAAVLSYLEARSNALREKTGKESARAQ